MTYLDSTPPSPATGPLPHRADRPTALRMTGIVKSFPGTRACNGAGLEVAEGEVRIMGSKSRLLQTLVAGSGVNSVPTQGLKWRRGGDSNPRYP